MNTYNVCTLLLFTKYMTIVRTSKMPEWSYPNTLIVLSATTKAKPFYLSWSDVHEWDVRETDKTEYTYSDKEWMSTIGWSSEATVPWFNEKDEMHYQEIFLQFLAEKISASDKLKNFERIVVCGPASLKNKLYDHLPHKLSDKVETKEWNYINHTYTELYDVIQKTLK